MISNKLLSSRRKSYIELGEVYFWTATINNWIHLLEEDSYKKVILDSLTNLSNRGLVDIYAFTIMPNHIHLIWRINHLNGKETVPGSFLKYTAHQFKKMLLVHPKKLLKFAVNAKNKRYEFWQRDALAIELYSKAVMLQKLHYIHMNPLASHWQLAMDPNDYYWSSASYYEQGVKEFEFLKSVWTVFD